MEAPIDATGLAPVKQCRNTFLYCSLEKTQRALVHFSHDLPMAKWQNGEIANGKMDKLAILIITHFALVLVWTQNTQQTKSSNQ